jgi:chlorite dismutase
MAIAPEWRRLSLEARFSHMEATRALIDRTTDVISLVFTSFGLEPGVDIVLWRSAPAVDALEAAAARLLADGIGPWLTVRHAFLARMAPSQYASTPTEQESALVDGPRARYLVVYPFSKSVDWYLLAREARQGIMNEHMRVGRAYPSVRQALGYSFGLDDQDFVVAYETDDLAAFGDLVRELRGTESRRATTQDTPVLVAVRRDWSEITSLLGLS